MDNNSSITVVSVHSPLIQFSTSGSYYTSYAISLKSNDPCFTHPYSQVRRRFSEFLELRRLLDSHYPTIKCPDLPPKNYFYRFSDSFIEKRKTGLQNFLEKVISTSVYLSDKSLHLFLQSSSNMNQIFEECIGDIPAPQLMDYTSDLTTDSETSSGYSSYISNKVISINDDHTNSARNSQTKLKENEKQVPTIKITPMNTLLENSNSLPFCIPKRHNSLDSSPASSLSSLDTSECSSLDLNRRRVSFNENVTVAVVYNHLWNIGTRPIRTDA